MVIILALAIGLSLTMLIAKKAVSSKIESVKSSIGNTITISPAGFSAGSEINNALTVTELNKIKSLPNIIGLDESLTDRLPTTGSSTPSFGRFGGSPNSGSTTSLTSPTVLNFNQNGNNGHFFAGGGFGRDIPSNFSLPVSFLGTSNPFNVNGNLIVVSSGKNIDGNGDLDNALISSQMASKNNLKIGSTFTAYNQTITVAGIFTSSDRSTQNTVILPLATLQNLNGQSGSVTSAVATINNLDNLTTATNSIKTILGSNADVVSAEDQANSATAPLNSVKTVATFSLIGAVVAGAVIILLLMIIIVRERKREIGIVKAIGGSNIKIAIEFASEALVLTIAGAIIALLLAVVTGQPITNALVSNNSGSNSSQNTAFGSHSTNNGNNTNQFSGSDRHNFAGFSGSFRHNLQNNPAIRGLDNIQTQIGWSIILDGLGVAVVIAIISSLLTTVLTSRIRPAVIIRNE